MTISERIKTRLNKIHSQALRIRRSDDEGRVELEPFPTVAEGGDRDLPSVLTDMTWSIKLGLRAGSGERILNVGYGDILRKDFNVDFHTVFIVGTSC